MKMTVKKTSVFPENKNTVFALLQRFDTLAYIAKPYATFKSSTGQTELFWEVGKSFAFDFKMLGFIPIGVHVINVKNSVRTTSIQMRAILVVLYGIVELFSKKLPTAKPNTPTR